MPLDGTLYEDEILRVLHTAQERIRDPENWCQYSYGLNSSPNCAVGALLMTPRSTPEALGLLNTASKQIGYDGASILNDRTNHPTVMAMFDCAIKLRLAEIMEVAIA